MSFIHLCYKCLIKIKWSHLKLKHCISDSATLNVNKKFLYLQIFGDDKNLQKTLLRLLYLWLNLWFFPVLRGAQVDSKIKEQTEVQVGCNLGKNMFYQGKKKKRIQPPNLLLCMHLLIFLSYEQSPGKRITASHKAIEDILCD